MIAGDDFADFLAGQVMLVTNPGPIVQEGNRILFLIAGEGEELVHHAVGQENAIVGRVVIAVTHALHHADNLEADVVQQDRVAHRSPAIRETSSSAFRRR